MQGKEHTPRSGFREQFIGVNKGFVGDIGVRVHYWLDQGAGVALFASRGILSAAGLDLISGKEVLT